MPIAFVDTETFGLDPDRHPIWEIAVIVENVDGVWEEHCWQVARTTSELAQADPTALDINRFRERRGAAETLLPVESITRFFQLVHNCHLAGAVVSFDEERIRREYTALHVGRELWPWHYHLIDVEALAVGVLTERGHRIELPWNSDHISDLLEVPRDPNRHSALADARWAKAIYDACTQPQARSTSITRPAS